MAIEELNAMLIEGFDPRKIQENNTDNSLKWKEIQAAYQNDTILNDMLVGFENIIMAGRKELCGIIRMDSIKGLIPLSESGVDPEDKQAINKFRALTGKKVAFKILKFDHENELFIASRKQAKEQMAEITLRKIDEGYTIYCVVREVEPGHLIGDIGGIDVHIPVFELTYGWVDDLRDHYKPGDHLKVQVTKIDKEKLDVKVSAKLLLQNPFPDCTKRYQKNGEYLGKVSGVQDYGVFINLEAGVDSLAPHLKFQNVQKGDRVLVRVVKVDVEKEQIRTKIVRVL